MAFEDPGVPRLRESGSDGQDEHFTAWEPSIVPTPEFLAGGTVRFSCPRGCGWHHDENPGLDAAMESYRLVLPVGATPQDVTEAINREASADARALRERVTAALVDHDQQAHSRPAA